MSKGEAPRRTTVVTVVNYRLPPGDYRVQLGLRHNGIRMIFGLPERPATVKDRDFLLLRFGEGVRARELVEFFRLFRWLRANRSSVDLIHFFSTKLVLFGPLVAGLAGVAPLVTVTGFGRVFVEDGWRSSAARRVYMALLGRASRLSLAVLFQNRGDMAWAIQHVPAVRGKSHWVGSGVAMDVPGRRDYNADPLVVLLVSRLLPSKGIPDFLEVAQRLQGSDFRFVLAGPASPDYPELHEEVRRAADRGLLTYLGTVTGDALTHLFGAAQVFLFPSYGEGMARVMLEAGFAGLCPVAYDINANRELILAGGGRLVKRGDIDSLAASLRDLAVNRRLLETEASQYQTHVTSRFTVAAYESRFVPLVASLLPSPHSVAAR